MDSSKSFPARGSHLEARLAFVRTDFSCSNHRSELDFANDEPVIFQSLEGDLDQFAQVAFVLFGFDEPIDGVALTVNGNPDSSVLSANLNDAGLRAGIENLLVRSFVKNARVANTIADLIAGYWGFGGDFDDLEEDVLQRLEDEQFAWMAEDAADILSVDDDRCGGGILIEMVLAYDLLATVNPDGTLEVADDIDWDEHRRDKCICWIKPTFAYGLSPAKG